MGEPALVGDGDRGAVVGGELAGALGEAGVRSDDDHVLQSFAAQRLGKHRQRRQIVHRNREEALDLGRMQVDRDDPVHARSLQRISADAGPDRHPRLVLLVALGVAEIGDHRGHRPRAGPLQCVDVEQQLHEVVVGGEDCRLDDVGVSSAHVLQDPDEGVAFGELQGLVASRIDAQGLADPRREPGTSGSAEDQHLVHRCGSISDTSTPPIAPGWSTIPHRGKRPPGPAPT